MRVIKRTEGRQGRKEGAHPHPQLTGGRGGWGRVRGGWGVWYGCVRGAGVYEDKTKTNSEAPSHTHTQGEGGRGSRCLYCKPVSSRPPSKPDQRSERKHGGEDRTIHNSSVQETLNEDRTIHNSSVQETLKATPFQLVLDGYYRV